MGEPRFPFGSITEISVCLKLACSDNPIKKHGGCNHDIAHTGVKLKKKKKKEQVLKVKSEVLKDLIMLSIQNLKKIIFKIHNWTEYKVCLPEEVQKRPAGLQKRSAGLGK